MYDLHLYSSCGDLWCIEEPPPQLPPPRQRKVPPSSSNAATPQDSDHDRTLVVKQVRLFRCFYWNCCWLGWLFNCTDLCFCARNKSVQQQTWCTKANITVDQAWFGEMRNVTGWSAWLSGRTPVSGQRSFAVLRSTCSWWVTTYVDKPSAIGQPTRPTKPFILSGSINK